MSIQLRRAKCDASSFSGREHLLILVLLDCFRGHDVADSHTERLDTGAFCKEADFICAGTGSVDLYPKAEPQTQWALLYIPPLGFLLHFGAFVPLIW